MLVALLLAAPNFAFAQGSNVKVMANFDNPVHVGNGQVLAPGPYTFNIEQDQTDRPVFRVQGSDGKNVTLTGTNIASRQAGVPVAGKIPDKSTITLENIDGTYYLHNISLGGQDRGFEFQLPSNVRDKVNSNTHVVIPASGGNAQ
jgi:hypothetical protein